MSKKLDVLDPHPLLIAAAQMHSDDMINQNIYIHISPKSKKHKTMYDRVRSVGGIFDYISENILENNPYNLHNGEEYSWTENNGIKNYYITKTKKPIGKLTYNELAEKLVNQWLNSTPHRKNILNKNIKYMGVNTAISSTPIKKSMIS